MVATLSMRFGRGRRPPIHAWPHSATSRVRWCATAVTSALRRWRRSSPQDTRSDRRSTSSWGWLSHSWRTMRPSDSSAARRLSETVRLDALSSVRAVLTCEGIVHAHGDLIMVVMAHAQPQDEGPPAIGALLQYWRRARNLSQLALAHKRTCRRAISAFSKPGAPDRAATWCCSSRTRWLSRCASETPSCSPPASRQCSGVRTRRSRARTRSDRDRCHPEAAGALSSGGDESTLGHRGDERRATPLLRRAAGRTGARLRGQRLRLMFHPDGLRPSSRTGTQWLRHSSIACTAKRWEVRSTTRDGDCYRRFSTTPGCRPGGGRRTSERHWSPSCR